MSDQQVTSGPNPCISSAPKSLGQVGYEAMLDTVYVECIDFGWDKTDWAHTDESNRQAWETIAIAIEIAVKEQVIKEVAQQMGAKL